MKTSECRSCGAAIIWATTEKGRKMPLDAKPTSTGSFVLEDVDGDPRAIFMKGPQACHKYESHFKTCPNAKEHSHSSRPAPAAKSPCRPDGDGFCVVHPPCDMMRAILGSLRSSVR